MVVIIYCLIFAVSNKNTTTMRASKKDLTCDMGKNLKMNDEVYALRKEVMGYIYEAKNLLKAIGVEMPRIDVRITDNTGTQGKSVGYGHMGHNTIWISTLCLNQWNKHVREVVFHELLHAILCTDHNEECPLMRANLHSEPLSNEVINKNFVKYFK